MSDKITDMLLQLKRLKNLKRRQIIAGLIGGVLLLLISSSWVLGYFYYQAQQQELTYHLNLSAHPIESNVYQVATKGEVMARVELPVVGSFNFQTLPTLLLHATIDNNQVFEQAIPVAKYNRNLLDYPIPIDLSSATDGEHLLKVTLSDQADHSKIFDEKTLKITNDKTSPLLLKVTTDKGSLSRYKLEQDKTASSSAENGIKLITNSKGPLNLNWSFSELVKPGSELASGGATLTFTESSTATVAGTIALGGNATTAKVPLTFQDRVGNQLRCEVQYIFDAQAPQLGELHEHRLWEQTKDNFFFTFTSTEPLASAKASVNGATKVATGGPKHYRVDGLPLVVGTNVIKIVAYDAAGNVVNAEKKATMQAGAPKTYSFESFGKASLPPNVRHCNDEDKKICGYENVSDMTCEQFQVVKDCLHSRCSRTGFSLGSCDD